MGSPDLGAYNISVNKMKVKVAHDVLHTGLYGPS